jgi:hypothetical protein
MEENPCRTFIDSQWRRGASMHVPEGIHIEKIA